MKADYTFWEQDTHVSPQLVFYKDIISENIDKMIRLAGGPEKLWPHVKTHKIQKLVELQIAKGIRSFKCATIAEAEMCGMAGAERVALAYPLVGPNVSRFFQLVKVFPDTTFYAVGDNSGMVEAAGKAAREEGLEISFLMDVDLGQGRTGVAPEDAAGLYQLWNTFDGIHMCGLHCYDGHRHEADFNERMALVKEEDEKVSAIRRELSDAGLEPELVILGGTPSFPCHVRLMPEDHFSPGTCVVWDHGYDQACPDMDFTPGAAVLTRVVSHRGEDVMTLDMGTKGVASDPRPERASIVGFEDAVTVLQNEEHWVVRVPFQEGREIPPIGTVLFAIPTHICPTSQLYPSVPVVENGVQTDVWNVTARDRRITI